MELNLDTGLKKMSVMCFLVFCHVLGSSCSSRSQSPTNSSLVAQKKRVSSEILEVITMYSARGNEE